MPAISGARIVKTPLRGRCLISPLSTIRRARHMDTEGSFSLVAVVEPTTDKPGKWTAHGRVHVGDAVDPVETVLAGDSFETREVAHVAAIEAARQVAATRAQTSQGGSAPF